MLYIVNLTQEAFTTFTGSSNSGDQITPWEEAALSKLLAAYNMPPTRAGQISEGETIAQHPEAICKKIARVVV